MGYKAEEKAPLSIRNALMGGYNLNDTDVKLADKLTGRQLYNTTFRHVYNRLPINRILAYAFSDYILEFYQGKELTQIEYDPVESCRNLLIDGWLFERVDEFGINWLENVVDYKFFAGQLMMVKQKWDYEDGTTEYHLYDREDMTYTIAIYRGKSEISREVFEFQVFPIVGCVLNQNHEYYLYPSRYLQFRLNRILENIARNNDKHSKDRLHISGSITNREELQQMLNVSSFDTALVLPEGTTAEYPKVWNNADNNRYEIENVTAQILSVLNIVDIAQLNMSGVSRRLAMQPMTAFAKQLRKEMKEQVEGIAELLGDEVVYSYGAIEPLDAVDKKIELELLDTYKDIIGDDAYNVEVLRILDISQNSL